MPATYEPIATTTLGSAQSSVTFSSISGSYTDIILVVNAKANTGTANIVWEVNSDTGTNYSYTYVNAEPGGVTASGRASSTASPYLNFYGYLDTTWGNWIAHFMNYSNTTTYKSVLARFNNSNNGTGANVGLWRSTSAITQIKIKTSANNFDTGSTFTLYGIKAA